MSNYDGNSTNFSISKLKKHEDINRNIDIWMRII